MSDTDEPKLLGMCDCGCREEIYQGVKHLVFDGFLLYSAVCLVRIVDAEWSEGE